MIKSKISVAVLFLLCLCWLPTLSLAKGKSHFTVEDSQYGTRLVKWEGKDSVVDFNNIQELKDVKVIGEMAFEMNKYIKQVIPSRQFADYRKNELSILVRIFKP